MWLYSEKLVLPGTSCSDHSAITFRALITITVMNIISILKLRKLEVQIVWNIDPCSRPWWQSQPTGSTVFSCQGWRCYTTSLAPNVVHAGPFSLHIWNLESETFGGIIASNSENLVKSIQLFQNLNISVIWNVVPRVWVGDTLICVSCKCQRFCGVLN